MNKIPFANVDNIAEPGIGTKLVNAAFTPLRVAGNILDTPGSILRGLVSGNTERAFEGIFDTEKRVTGSELLGYSPSKFTWSGLGAEVALDPLTYIGVGGLTAAGKAVSTGAKLTKTLKAQKVIGKILEEGAKESTLYKVAAGRAENTASVLQKLKAANPALTIGEEGIGKTLAEQARRGERSLLSFNPIFTNINIPLVTGETAFKGLDKLGTGIKAIPGVAQTTNLANKLFKTTPELEALKPLQQEYKFLERESRAEASKLQHRYQQKISVLTKELGYDPSEQIIQAVELGDVPEKMIQRLGLDDVTTPHDLRTVDLLRARLSIEEELSQLPQEVIAFADEVRGFMKARLDQEKALGVPVDELNDNLGYISRRLTREGAAILKGKKARDIVTTYLGGERFQRERLAKGFTLSELNQLLAKAHNLPETTKFFDDDIPTILASRLLQGRRAENNSIIVQTASELFKKTKDKGLTSIAKLFGKPEAELTRINGKIVFKRGPLVTSTRIPFAVNEGDLILKTDAVRKAIDGVTGEIDWAKVNNDLNEKISLVSKNPEVFKALSKGHRYLDQRWDRMVQVGILTPDMQQILRYIFTQINPDVFKTAGGKIDILTAKQLEKKWAGVDPKFGYNPSFAGTYYRKDWTTRPTLPSALNPKDGSFLPPVKNPVFGKPNHIELNIDNIKEWQQRFPNAGFSVFLHEFGHALDLSGFTSSELRGNVTYIYDTHTFDAYGDLFKLLESREPINKNSVPYYLKNNRELMAQSFVHFVLGNKLDPTLQSLGPELSEQARYLKDWISKITQSNPKFDRPITMYLFIQDLNRYLNIAFQRHLKATDNVVDRELFIDSLSLEPGQRAGYLDVRPTASLKEIKDVLKKNGVKDTYIEPEIIDGVHKMLGMTKQQNIPSPFIRALDDIHALYRAAFTGYSPAFHSRNFISGVFMNALAGIMSPKHYFKAIETLRSIDEVEYLRLAAYGVLDEGKLRETFELVGNPRGKVSKATTKLFGPGHHLGQAVDNVNRLAHYYGKISEGKSEAEAAESVIKYLFDYGDLTDFERAYPRRLMLFYTFWRKNLPLMLRQIVDNPQFVVNYQRAIGATNPKIIEPPWLADSFFFGEDEQGQHIRVNFGLPPEDLARFDPQGRGLQRVFELLIANAVPAIRVPYEFIADREAFFGRPAEGSAAEKFVDSTPGARVFSDVQRILNSENITKDIDRFLTGVNVKSIDTTEQEKINQLHSLRNKLESLRREGRARQIPTIGNLPGKHDPEVDALNSAMAKIYAERKKSN